MYDDEDEDEDEVSVEQAMNRPMLITWMPFDLFLWQLICILQQARHPFEIDSLLWFCY